MKNVLEEILEEIEQRKQEHKYNAVMGIKETVNRMEELNWADALVRYHMNDAMDTNVLTKDGWIPVEERLPEDEGNVLVVVTGRYKAVRFENAIMLGNYSSTDKDWIIEGWEEWENPNVIAWQPLPEPYKGE